MTAVRMPMQRARFRVLVIPVMVVLLSMVTWTMMEYAMLMKSPVALIP